MDVYHGKFLMNIVKYEYMVVRDQCLAYSSPPAGVLRLHYVVLRASSVKAHTDQSILGENVVKQNLTM